MGFSVWVVVDWFVWFAMPCIAGWSWRCSLVVALADCSVGLRCLGYLVLVLWFAWFAMVC